jgi:hypothetical protein
MGKSTLVQYSYRRITSIAGKMVGSRSKAQWELALYFDLDTNTLWSRTGEGFGVHSCIPISSNTRNTQFHLQTIQQLTLLH